MLLTVLTAAVLYCPVEMYPDYLTGIAYKAILRMAPGCPTGSVGRVRKISRITGLQTPGGKPEYGGVWGWNLNWYTSLVPERALWTSFTTEWESYYDGKWNRVIRR